MLVAGTILSKRGFYIGDICYVLGHDFYYNVWGNQHGFGDGIFEDSDTSLRFAVAGTAYGDGCYHGSDGSEFSVDAGVIGLVPLELVEKVDGVEDGKVVNVPGIAYFKSEDGHFEIETPDGKTLFINTEWDNEFEYE